MHRLDCLELFRDRWSGDIAITTLSGRQLSGYQHSTGDIWMIWLTITDKRESVRAQWDTRHFVTNNWKKLSSKNDKVTTYKHLDQALDSWCLHPLTDDLRIRRVLLTFSDSRRRRSCSRSTGISVYRFFTIMRYINLYLTFDIWSCLGKKHAVFSANVWQNCNFFVRVFASGVVG